MTADLEETRWPDTSHVRARRAVRRWRLQGWRIFLPERLYAGLIASIEQEIAEIEHNARKARRWQ